MKPPFAKWDDNNSEHPELVWWSRLDGRYQVEVQRTGSHTAELVVYDHQDNDKELMREAVGLSYGAQFGPDVSDVAFWQQKSMDFVDNMPKQ
jgi:hypothetical protein